MCEKFVLHYFPLNGRGIIPRAILYYAKANWVDNVIGSDEWFNDKKFSNLFEFHRAPVLEYKGKKLCQSMAIIIYLSQLFNIYGRDIDEQYEINSLLNSYEELLENFRKWNFCEDPAKKETLKQAGIDEFKLYIDRYEKRYQRLGNGPYYLGDHFSTADIYLACAIPTLHDILWKPDIDEVMPNLKKLLERIRENELKGFFDNYFYHQN